MFSVHFSAAVFEIRSSEQILNLNLPDSDEGLACDNPEDPMAMLEEPPSGLVTNHLFRPEMEFVSDQSCACYAVLNALHLYLLETYRCMLDSIISLFFPIDPKNSLCSPLSSYSDEDRLAETTITV